MFHKNESRICRKVHLSFFIKLYVIFIIKRWFWQIDDTYWCIRYVYRKFQHIKSQLKRRFDDIRSHQGIGSTKTRIDSFSWLRIKFTNFLECTNFGISYMFFWIRMVWWIFSDMIAFGGWSRKIRITPEKSVCESTRCIINWNKKKFIINECYTYLIILNKENKFRNFYFKFK